jgi:uncharacterized protein YbjT (DUF2867 family)
MGLKSNIKVILTGATGMVGEGVLIECLQHPSVEQVLLINRRPSGFQHLKLKEIVHSNFNDLSSIQNQLTGFDACFFCAGVSSVGMNEAKYTELTYTLTLNFARSLSSLNKEMVFCYVSGTGTDSSEKGKSMWARVKGKTENDLMRLPFAGVYNFRPGALIATNGQKNVLKMYKYLSWLIPIIKLLSPKHIGSLADLGKAMINASIKGSLKHILEVPDIHNLAKA